MLRHERVVATQNWINFSEAYRTQRTEYETILKLEFCICLAHERRKGAECGLEIGLVKQNQKKNDEYAAANRNSERFSYNRRLDATSAKSQRIVLEYVGC